MTMFEHILLGLLREQSIWKVIQATGIALRSFREDVGSGIEKLSALEISVAIPFSRSSVQLLTNTALEADRLGDREIQPEHMLLALLDHLPNRWLDGTVPEVRRDAGANHERARR
jgi:ATP-dependent Clp protease ATP-binding subunit ClpA